MSVLQQVINQENRGNVLSTQPEMRENISRKSSKSLKKSNSTARRVYFAKEALRHPVRPSQLFHPDWPAG